MLRLACLACLVLLAMPGNTAPVEIAQGVHLFPGQAGFEQQPDGNSVVIRAPQGLIVIDTGRHATHTHALLDFARTRDEPVAVIINTHWHLDHISGNPRLREAWPALRVYASPALAGALDDFLANYRLHLERTVRDAALPPARLAELRAELAILDQAQALAPDVVLDASATRTIAGRKLDLHVETATVTGGDVWVFDPASGVLVAGDLVTLPVPFLDTACPARWRAALQRLSAEEFDLLVPGHGPPMTRNELGRYRMAFGRLLDCAASAASNAHCAAGWMEDAGSLIREGDEEYANALLSYYLDNHLRGGDPQRQAKLCKARDALLEE